MGNIRMVVLTKSSKYGNNCVAGIDLSNGDWIRLVTEDEASHGAVSDNDLICEGGRSVEVLDVIDVPILGMCNDCVQPENVLLDLDTYIEIKGRMTLDEVLKIHPLERKRNILGNDYGYITEARVNTVGYSLIIVEVFDLVITQEENPYGKPKTKAKFIYQGTEYENMSVTDQKFYSIRSGSKFERAILVVSIGTPYNSRYYKFVSAIFI
ncbi:dual OB domain-containing protein [Otoolea muris]|jgi:hypothetical protein|uniref:dual OB domain-containing protein n=1 Tax=Otoolea muris TaxID=2941515 RepID=UPI00203B273E|nr:hypothetical protein [Otoolea muris]